MKNESCLRNGARIIFFGTLLAVSLMLVPTSDAKKQPSNDPFEAFTSEKFDREQTMVLNLKKGVGSSGYYLLHSLNQTRQMMEDIDKAIKQAEAVDRTFAKSRGKPDSRFLERAQLKMIRARETAQQLETHLQEAFYDLKKDIEDTIAFDEGRRKN
ncbi:MAG TPA: hypothetical protein V6D17_08685 [Candidatus Obscuribacterales bacterium]